MKKKDYQTPAMTVVMMKQQQQLLAGSVKSMRSGYGSAQEQTWGDEEE